MGDEVEIVGLRDTQKPFVRALEMFRKLLDEGCRRQRSVLRGTKRDDVERASIIKSATISASPASEAEVYVLSKEEGGRHTPFFNGYRPQFYRNYTGTRRFSL